MVSDKIRVAIIITVCLSLSLSLKIVDSNYEREGVSPELKDGDDQNQTCEALQDFINEKFHNILIEKIKIEVKNALNKTLIALVIL